MNVDSVIKFLIKRANYIGYTADLTTFWLSDYSLHHTIWKGNCFLPHRIPQWGFAALHHLPFVYTRLLGRLRKRHDLGELIEQLSSVPYMSSAAFWGILTILCWGWAALEVRLGKSGTGISEFL